MSKERELLKEFIDFVDNFVDSYEFYPTERSVIWEIVNRANAILAQPEQDKAQAVMPNGVCVSNVYDAYEEGRKSVMVYQEPVAWMWEDKRNGSNSWATVVTNAKPEKCEYHIRNIRPLYLASPKREPLSDEEIAKNTPKLIHIGERLAFHAGVRFAERHHIIGGGE